MIKLLQFGFEWLLMLVILVFVYAQVIRPLVVGTPVFPMFRKRPNLEREMEEVTEELRDQEQAQNLARAMKRIKASKGDGNVGNKK